MWILYLVLAITAAFGGGAYALLPSAPVVLQVAAAHSLEAQTSAVLRSLRRAHDNAPGLFPAFGPSAGPQPLPVALVERFLPPALPRVPPGVVFMLDGRGTFSATLSPDSGAPGNPSVEVFGARRAQNALPPPLVKR